jgi:hypothetical protein
MRHVISMGAKRHIFMKRSDLQSGETPLALTQVSARQIIDPMMRNPMSNRVLRALLKEVSAFAVLAKLGDTEVSSQLVKRLVSGEIKVVAEDPAAAGGQKKKVDPPAEEKPAPKVMAATAQDDVHWIKFKVVDEKDQPLKGIKLNLALAGKAAKPYDVAGAFLHIKELAPGTCDIKSVDSDGVYEVVEFKG